MSIVGSNALAGASGQSTGGGGGGGFRINRSLRFNSADSAYLSRTPSSAGNRTTWTWSAWLKRSALAGSTFVFGAGSGFMVGGAHTAFMFTSDDKLQAYDYTGSGYAYNIVTTRLFRDPAAWYHIVLAIDTTQSTSTDRVKLYINGELQTALDTTTYPSQNYETYVNTASLAHQIGHSNTDSFDGYLTDVHFIDGQALAPTDFGEFDDNNVWNPKQFEGTYNTAASFPSYPGVTISPSAVGGGSVSHVNGGGTYFYSQASSGAGSIKVEFSSPITGVTSIKYNGGGYSVNSAYNIRINGVDVFTNLSTNSSWAQASHTISSTDISSFEIYTANDGWSLYNLLFNDTSPSGTASLGTPAGVNGFHLDFSDNSSNAALGTDSSGLGTTLPGVSFDGSGDVVSSADHSDFTLGTNDWTIEYFVNPASFETYDVTVSKYGNSSYSWWHAFLSDGSLIFYLYDSSSNSVTVTSTTAFTANKWAHVAIVRDGNTLRMYVDGVQEDTTSITGWTVHDSTAAVTIGEDGDGNYDFSGVISNVRIVNGTCLYPNGTTFTVPSTPLTDVTNTKLLCCQSSSSATAATVSPNTLTTSGNPFATSKNDTAWTVNNLQAAGSAWDQSQTWSSEGSGTPYTSAFDWDKAFNGIITTSTDVTFGASGATMTWTPSSAITVNTSVTLYVYNATNGSSYGTRVNGSYIAGTNNYNVPVTLTAATLGGQLTSIQLTNSGLVGPYLGGVEVDGVLLVDSGVADTAAPNIDSLIDTPTNYTATGSGNNGGNYATINPLSTSSTLANGNLQLTTNSGLHYSTIGVSSAKWYAEWNATSAGGSQMVGIAKGLAGGSYLGSNSDGFGYYGSNGQKYNGSGVNYGATYGSGDIIGVALNLDDGNITFYKNGVSQGTAFTGLSSGTYFFAGGESGMTGYWNFGQRGSFAYTPPTGYVSLCTTNLPDPTIADGSTAMDVKLYTGTGSTQTISNLGFSPDLVWIKRRSGSAIHVLNDTIRGAGVQLSSNSADAETTNTNNFAAFTSDGFTVGTGSGTNASPETHVAWTWDGGDLVTISDTTNYNQSQTWSNLVTGTLETSYGNSSATAPFDGDTGSNYPDGIRPTSGNYLSMNFGTTFANATSVKIYGFASLDGVTYSGSEENLKINGTAIGASEWSGSGQSSQTFSLSNGLTSLEWGYSSGSQSTGYLYLSGIEVDGKLLMNPGVIPAGGLNSSVYNQDAVWSNEDTWPSASYSTTPDNAFEANFGNLSPSTSQIWYSSGASTVTLTNLAAELGTGVTNVKVWVYDRFGNVTLTVNSNSASAATDNAYQEISVDHDGSAITTLTIQGTDSSYWGLGGIKVNGRELVDSNVTVTNVPTIASTVRANPSAGFSCVGYSSSSNAVTVGHGLNAAPELILLKDRNNAYDWIVITTLLANTTDYLVLNSTAASANFGVDAPTSTTFIPSQSANSDYIAYCFAPVEGYSKFGKFSGNSSTDGPFQFCGFKPRFLLLKGITQARDWIILDTARDSGNVGDSYLYPNSNGAEATYAIADILSNGFKMRYAGGLANQTGEDYVWAAFASHPFRTARAR